MAEDETLDIVASIAKAYPIAREKCDDNPKWEAFKTALNGLSPDICKDWEDKVEGNTFEANLTDLQLDQGTWEKIAALFAEAIKD